MSSIKFVWIIRTWCNLDTYWEHVRQHKEYDIAYTKAELLLEEIQRIISSEESEWEDMCENSGTKKEERVFSIDKPTLEQLKNRSFLKFLTITSTNKEDEFAQSWYVERVKVVDTA